LTIAGYKAFLAPILPPEVLALYLEALRKAGLPEAQAGVRPAHRPFGVAGLPAAKPGLEWG